jgi:hypothetical protein
MATATTSPAGLTLTLNEDERTHLITVLEQAVRDKRVEVHRTEAFAARELVGHQLTVLEELLAKLRLP